MDRPQSKEELQKREAIGLIRASRFVRNFARSHKEITIQTVCEIHQEIFKEAWPEIGGKYRNENLEITDSKHRPPHHSEVPYLMKEKDSELRGKLQTIGTVEGIIEDSQSNFDLLNESIDKVVRLAAWLHYIITFIHPFREGNGRTARLAANLILERYGLIGISVRIEKENKNKYCQALAQIDARQDFEPLVNLVYEGLIERYNGVPLKFYDVKK